MVVKYNAFDRFDKPKFILCRPGSVIDRYGQPSRAIGELCDHEAEEIVLNLDDISELNMRVNRVCYDDELPEQHAGEMYNAIGNRMNIFVENVGYFVITNVEESFDGHQRYKDITAKSAEVELKYKAIPFIQDGVYKLYDEYYDPSQESNALINVILANTPSWSIGSVDSIFIYEALSNQRVYRHFEGVDTDQDCYTFLTETIQDTFECIVEFDFLNKTVSVRDRYHFGTNTDVHITTDDLLIKTTVKNDAEKLYSALRVYGSDDVPVNLVNPLGGSVIYNFDYYLPMMSNKLRVRVEEWMTAVSTIQESYEGYAKDYYSYHLLAENYYMEYQQKRTVYSMYQQCISNLQSALSNTNSYDVLQMSEGYNNVIARSGGDEFDIIKHGNDVDIEATINNIKSLSDDVLDSAEDCYDNYVDAQRSELVYASAMAGTSEMVDMYRFFSVDEWGEPSDLYAELLEYIFEGTYTNDAIYVSSDADIDERFEKIHELYESGTRVLDMASQPTKEYELEVENFLFAKQFQKWSDQLQPGSIISIQLPNDDGSDGVERLMVSSISVNYDDNKMSIAVCNKVGSIANATMYGNLFNKISQNASSIRYVKGVIKPITSGEYGALKDTISNWSQII